MTGSGTTQAGADSGGGGPRRDIGRQVEHKIVVPAAVQMVGLLGTADEFLRVIEAAFTGTRIHVRGNEITVSGDPAELALVERLVDELILVLRTGQPLSPEAIERSVAMLRAGGGKKGGPSSAATGSGSPADVLTFNILSSRGRTIRPKTLNQKRYVDAIDKHTIVFGIGPAGTGKTYLAVAKAVQALQSKQVTRIILTRPAIEAGERLGFLPGTLYEKIDPYLRPLYDALHDMMDPDTIPRLMTAGTIEVAPLAYMRGRTLNDAFIILDEAQNTTPEQMKMFLTRLGFNSKMVVTGDITQTDLPSGSRSGLDEAQLVLDNIDDVAFLRLSSADVVRHRLVSEIVDAYHRHDSERAEAADRGGRSGRDGERPNSRSGHERPGRSGRR